MTDTAHRWRENDLDKELLKELASRNPSEERIRQLASQGADVNSFTEYGKSVLMQAISFIQDGLSIEFIHLLVELGADVNYQTEDGACALSDATTYHSPEAVEFLLERGANPNVIIEYSETILDDAKFDYWFHKDEIVGRELDPYWAEKMGEIVKILKHFGAKNLNDLFTRALPRLPGS
jgi:ankyrin repeat protein